MAGAKLINGFELDVIRVGVANGQKAPKIAAVLGRTRQAVHQQIKKMEKDGTIGDMPFCFVVDKPAGEFDAQE